MRKFVLLTLFLPMLFSCVPSYLEEAAFLELPFEYEGTLKTDEFVPEYDLHWAVPDNSDSTGLYFYAYSQWSMMNQLYYCDGDTYWSIFSLSDSRKIISLDEQGWFVQIYGSAPAEFMELDWADLPNKVWSVFKDSVTTNSVVSESTLYVYGDLAFAGNPGDGFTLDASSVDYSAGIFLDDPPNSVIPTSTLPLSTVTAMVYPEATSIWGSISVDVPAFAPSYTASIDSRHKFILSRTDGLTGERKNVLVNVDATVPDFTWTDIDADGDFYFVSRTRFVGMDGNVLKIFNQNGGLIKSHELENMRLLGFRSSTERELVFLYSSNEKDGDRVYGIYSLPAAYIEEARE